MTRRDEDALRCARQLGRRRVDVQAPLRRMRPETLLKATVRDECMLCNMYTIVQSVG
jgi:hypothetical protein